MRELLFRGQTRRKGEIILNVRGDPAPSNWVCGWGVTQGVCAHSIIYTAHPVEKHVVYTDTIGQYVDLCDKYGEKIFEGDIVIYKSEYYKVDFVNCEFVIVARNIMFSLSEMYDHDLEVVGNIYDNPELLSEEGQA